MEFVTKNTQKQVKINPASFKEASALKRAVMKIALQGDILKGVSLSQLNLSTSGMLTGLIQGVIGLDVSEEFENALMACLARCIYDEKYSINSQLFDDKPEIREDYYEIAVKCCEENLRPFFKSLVSELKARFNQADDNFPEQK